MKMISEGAEARIYSVRLMGIGAVLKRRIKKDYRIEDIDTGLRVARTKNEARIMALASELEINAPVLLFVDRYDIFMSRVDGTMLSDLLNSEDDLKGVFPILGKYAAILHNNNIAHGDYTPANIIVEKGENPHVIDFGLSEITTSIEEKALDLLLMKRSVDTPHFNKFMESYKHHCKDGGLILKRLELIEKRGRYNVRTLITG